MIDTYNVGLIQAILKRGENQHGSFDSLVMNNVDNIDILSFVTAILNLHNKMKRKTSKAMIVFDGKKVNGYKLHELFIVLSKGLHGVDGYPIRVTGLTQYGQSSGNYSIKSYNDSQIILLDVTSALIHYEKGKQIHGHDKYIQNFGIEMTDLFIIPDAYGSIDNENTAILMEKYEHWGHFYRSQGKILCISHNNKGNLDNNVIHSVIEKEYLKKDGNIVTCAQKVNI